MFPNYKQTTSHDRFIERIDKWNSKEILLPNLRHAFWWFVHNAIAHRIIAFFPMKLTFKFHDFTSDRINGKHIEEKPEKDHWFKLGEDLIFDYESKIYVLKFCKDIRPELIQERINEANASKTKLHQYMKTLRVKENFWNRDYAAKNNTIIDTILLTLEHKKMQPESMVDNHFSISAFEEYMFDFLYKRWLHKPKFGINRFLILSTNDLISLMDKDER